MAGPGDRGLQEAAAVRGEAGRDVGAAAEGRLRSGDQGKTRVDLGFGADGQGETEYASGNGGDQTGQGKGIREG